jgi:predicted DNA-binding WGR domain protein
MVFHLRLQAQHLERNINREYEILVYKVLFGLWGVILAFGRQGKNGTSKNHAFSTLQEAQKFVRKTVQKRLKAPKRIGCPYSLVSVKVDNLDHLSQWITPQQYEQLNN